MRDVVWSYKGTDKVDNRYIVAIMPSGEKFISVIEECISLYQFHINACRALRYEKVLEEVMKSETFLNARINLYKRNMNERLDSLLKNAKVVRDELKIYQDLLHDNSEMELRRKYDIFMKKWDELYVAITEKKSVLEKELGILSDDLNLSTPNPDSVKHRAVINQPELVFPRKFSLASAEELLSQLIEHGFIDSTTNLDDLCCVFSLSISNSENIKPIRWIKRTSTVGNNKISRVSLIDLLTILEYDERCIIGEKGQKYKRLNNCFIVEGKPFKANDFSKDMKHEDRSNFLNVKSEFHDDLLNIKKKMNFPQKK